MIIKIFISFFLIALAETINGILRVKFLYKKIGIKKAKITSFLIGSIVIITLNLILVPWISPQTVVDAFFIGFIWMSMMIAYDLYVGKVLFRLSWKKIFEDFNILKGNFLGIGMGFIFVLPYFILLLKS
ncbi:MAG: hypothetical protein C0628_04460 [Sulfurimonas sp.]|nr:MAG: hypothetical protein C0628_04460 [Sulfurimonas sp.]